MFVCPDYLDLNITTGGGCICSLGMKLIDASLQMMKDMKTVIDLFERSCEKFPDNPYLW